MWKTDIDLFRRSNHYESMKGVRHAKSTFAFATLLYCSPALAGPRSIECSALESEQADAGIDRLKDWPAVRNWFHRWAQCDDGGPAEGVSEAVSILLARHWNTTSRLASLSRRDPGFVDFVIRHIDETVPDDRWILVATSARTDCPTGATPLCKRINRAAKSAIQRKY